jgi:hypothetical protein
MFMRYIRMDLIYIRMDMRFIRMDMRYIRMDMRYIRMDMRYIRMDMRYIRMIYVYRRDLMVLNLRTLNWTELTPASPPPSGRSHLGMCAYDGKLFVFGQEFLKSPLHSGFT